MVRSRAIVKNCPECETRVAVATKSCKCGYSFFNARRSDRVRGISEASSTIEADTDERRRTSRIRREKPNYYDSQQFEKQPKKKEKKTQRKASSSEHSAEMANTDKSTSKEAAAIRAQRRRLRKEEQNGGADMCAKLTTQRQELANLILSELNCKIASVAWVP